MHMCHDKLANIQTGLIYNRETRQMDVIVEPRIYGLYST